MEPHRVLIKMPHLSPRTGNRRHGGDSATVWGWSLGQIANLWSPDQTFGRPRLAKMEAGGRSRNIFFPFTREARTTQPESPQLRSRQHFAVAIASTSARAAQPLPWETTLARERMQLGLEYTVTAEIATFYCRDHRDHVTRFHSLLHSEWLSATHYTTHTIQHHATSHYQQDQ